MENTSNTFVTFVFANKFEALTDDGMVKVVGGKRS